MCETLDNLKREQRTTLWTRDKIARLIELYRQNDCLWNHYTEAYKNKERRIKAIEDICLELEISKTDFCKKIHNLRNQFNSEMKKIDRRIEDSGGNLEPNLTACRWKHFESLKFLRDIIEPRPGGQSKNRLIESTSKLDYTAEEDAGPLSINNTMKENCTSALCGKNTTKVESTILDRSNKIRSEQSENTYLAGGSVTEESASETNINNKTHYIDKPESSQHISNIVCKESTIHQIDQCSTLISKSNIESLKNFEGVELLKARDQWDAFGELIASEFRHLNSDASRKKLKRKIMHAMIEVGDEDDVTSK